MRDAIDYTETPYQPAIKFMADYLVRSVPLDNHDTRDDNRDALGDNQDARDENQDA